MKDKICFLSGNTLKILAALFMVIDHVGLMFFPSKIIFRIIGRLAFPIFAFMISEGARYTKNKLRYFLVMFSIAAICQVFYFFFDKGSLYMCILVTFSISILLIYALHWLKATVFSDKSLYEKLIVLLLFIVCLTVVCILNIYFEIDYGFGGIMVPVFASLFDFREIDVPDSIKWLDSIPMRLVSASFGLLLLSINSGGIQYYCFLALIPLFLYSGKRGKYRMKYFFYLFYPLHLVALEVIYIAIHLL